MKVTPKAGSMFPLAGLLMLLAAPSVGCGQSKQATATDGPLGTSVASLVFAKRKTADSDIAAGSGQVIDYLRYVPGGGVYVLSPPKPDGSLTNLTAAFPAADIAGIDLSFDAKEVVFAMKTAGDDHYHLYTAHLETHEVHQKTFGDHDDVNPIYVPGPRFAYVTNEGFTEMGTRADEYNHGRVVTQLAVIPADGGDRKLCAQNLSHTVNPFLRHDGTIGYSRWEHLGGVNDVKLFRMNPDCTQMQHVAGQFGKPSNSLVQVSEISPNVMVGVATDRERTIQAGALYKIDARFAKKDGDPGEKRLDSEHVEYTALTPGVPTGSDPSPLELGRYRNPRGTDDGRIIASWADGWVNDTNELTRTPPDFALYVYDPATRQNQIVYNDRDAWDLYPIPVVPRAAPPAIGSVQNAADATKPAYLGSLDIKNTDLSDDRVETVHHYDTTDGHMASVPLGQALGSAVAVRIVEGFSSEGAPGVTMFGLTMDEGAAVLGEARVEADGSWFAAVPPYIPMHLQPVDKFGLSLRNQRLWIQAMPGEARVCGGCHESRTGDNTLGAGPALPFAPGRTPESFLQPVEARVEYPWDNKSYASPGKDMSTPAPAQSPPTNTVQQFLTSKCAGCHNSTQNGDKAQEFYHLTKTDAATGAVTDYPIPTLDLTDTPVTVYYDRSLRTWSSSYVSIFFPATAGMMLGAFKIVGEVPPKWGVPESARASVLIEKMNVKAADGTWAWDPATHPPHPENVGTTVTDEERQMMVRVMDLGGQYYGRKNTAFKTYDNNPVGGTKY